MATGWDVIYCSYKLCVAGGSKHLAMWIMHTEDSGSWLYQSTQLMTNLKIAQLKEQLRKEKEMKEKSKLKQQ
ncbi:hypothetical protein NQ317_009567 [Molorchus minor]|uniref:Uncharacterized protein n=1 Tax=Molorchus minor TaxID=1323400 RepID=A0ABQ9IY22_9CUCU|nr:hypothetical protein NQ317_009567 [Molorchus minor]